MTVAQLGLAVESSSVVAATPALDRMTAASQNAEVAAAKMTVASNNAAKSMGLWVDQAGRVRNATGQFASSLEKAQAQALATAGALDQQSAAAMRAASATLKVGTANDNLAAASKANTANIAAQFQDIAVSAQMGMGALQIGLQQGTQLAAVITQMENPIRGLGAAFLSVLSPVSLLVIGLTSLLAAGLQMVNWTAVAKGALNAVADALVVIAPYAVAAAAGLALLYAPAIISGTVSLILSLGNVATAVWGIATAIYATVGLPVLLIAGFTAMAAAAIIWRDDLAKMLGFDIVQIAEDGINAVVGFFVGAFNAIKGVWGLLPAAFSDIFTMAMNGAIDIVQNGVNGIIGALRGIPGLDSLAEADLSGFKGQLTGAAGEAGGIISTAMSDAQGQNYVGAGIKFIQGAASGAADALRGLADTLKDKLTPEQKKAAKEAERQKKAYDDITLSANQKIAASQLEAQTLGMTTEQINAQRYAQELLNKAANDNIKLTPKQVTELTDLGAAMAAAEAATKALSDIYDLGKETFRGFFSDLSSGIEQGKSLWGSLADAATNALQRIADKALEMAADGIWDAVFGVGKSLLFGNKFGSLGNDTGTGASWDSLQSLIGSAKGNVFSGPGISAYSNTVVTKPTLFPFANGIGLMGEAGNEAIMPLRRGPDGRLGVTAANQNGGGVVINVNNTSGAQVSARQNGTDAAGRAIIEIAVNEATRRIEGKMAKGNYRSLGVGPGLKRA